MRTRIEINIDRIILEDFPEGREIIIRRALKEELERLFGEEETSVSTVSVNKSNVVSGNDMIIGDGSGSESIGKQIAESIFKEITR